MNSVNYHNGDSSTVWVPSIFCGGSVDELVPITCVNNARISNQTVEKSWNGVGRNDGFCGSRKQQLLYLPRLHHADFYHFLQLNSSLVLLKSSSTQTRIHKCSFQVIVTQILQFDRYGILHFITSSSQCSLPFPTKFSLLDRKRSSARRSDFGYFAQHRHVYSFLS